MRKFTNCEMTASNVTLKLKGGITEYKIYGFSIIERIDGIDMICLQPADLRKKPVMKVPVELVASIEAQF